MSGASIRARTRPGWNSPAAQRSEQPGTSPGVRSAVLSNRFKACRYRRCWYQVVISMQKPGPWNRVTRACGRRERPHAVVDASPCASSCCRLGVSPTASVGSSMYQARCGCVAVRNPHYAKSNPHGGADTTLGALAARIGVML